MMMKVVAKGFQNVENDGIPAPFADPFAIRDKPSCTFVALSIDIDDLRSI